MRTKSNITRGKKKPHDSEIRVKIVHFIDSVNYFSTKFLLLKTFNLLNKFDITCLRYFHNICYIKKKKAFLSSFNKI